MTENSDFWFDYDRTPRDVTDMNGRRLEIGEEPVKVTVFAPGFGRKYPWGHVQMEYEGLVIDFEAGAVDHPHLHRFEDFCAEGSRF